MHDKLVISFTIGLTTVMFLVVIGLSQIEARWAAWKAPWGIEPDWQRPLFIVEGATVCPAKSGAEHVLYHPAQRSECFRLFDSAPITVLDHSESPLVMIKTSGAYGWTWWGQLHN